MPKRHIPTPSTIHRTHLSYEHEYASGCLNIFHDAVDCYSAGLSLKEYCNPCLQHLLRNSPTDTLNGVRYVLDIGDGHSKPHYYPCMGDTPVYEEVYVWRCWEWLEYTAPHHVAQALDERFEFAEEIRAAERAAGWPS